jgi:hypothetical protein
MTHLRMLALLACALGVLHAAAGQAYDESGRYDYADWYGSDAVGGDNDTDGLG